MPVTVQQGKERRTQGCCGKNRGAAWIVANGCDCRCKHCNRHQRNCGPLDSGSRLRLLFPELDGVAIEPGKADENKDDWEHGNGSWASPASGDPGQGGSGAGQGEENSDKKLLGETEPALGGRHVPGDVDRGEIGERRSGQNGVALAGCKGHGMKHQRKGHDGCRERDGQEDAAVFPVKMMASAERRMSVSSVQQTVAYVGAPGGQRYYRDRPPRQADLHRPGKGEGPDNGYGGGVEAGEVPHAQRSRGVEASSKPGAMLRLQGGRQCGHNSHSSILRL